MIKVLLWIILFAISAPLALLVLFLYPILWLLSIPFRLLGIAVDGLFGLLHSIFMLPARVLSGSRLK